MKSLVAKLSGENAYDYISRYADPEAVNTLVVHTTNDFNILNNPNKFNTIINLGKVNDIRFINKFFEGVNSKLEIGDLFISRFETFTARKSRKKINKIPLVRTLYFGLEFVFLRVFPKTPLLKKVYFFCNTRS